MKLFNTSIAGMMAVILVAGVGFAALRQPSQQWASITFSLVLACLAVAAVLAVARSGRGRAGWAGMAVFGLVYISWAFGGESGGYPPLVTTRLLNSVAERLPGNADREAFFSSPSDGKPLFLNIRDGSLTTYNTWRQFPATYFDLTAFHQIGHSMMALLFGVVGAALGRLVAARTESQRLYPPSQ